jgi:hypothetical protein
MSQYAPKKTLKNGKAGASLLLWIRPDEPLPTRIATLVAEEGITPQVISFGGGNNGLSEELKGAMPGYFGDGFRGFTGTAFSGGTGHFNAERDHTSFEITTVPPLLASQNDCAAIGMTPMTTTPSLQHHSGSVNCDDYGGELDPRHHANVVVSNKPSDVYLGWNGDLKQRYAFFEELLELGYKVGVFIFNGGDVTTEEIYRAVELTPAGLELFVVEGSQREADKFVRAYRDGKVEATNAKGKDLAPEVAQRYAAAREGAEGDNITILPIGDVAALRAALISKGFLVEAPAAPAAEPAAEAPAAE